MHRVALSDRLREAPPEAGERDATAGTGLPSTGLRVARLAQAPSLPAVVTLQAAGTGAVEDELRHPRRLLARKVIQDCVHA